jgi:arabinan endo-1,5-alpha-L-arabinosidase
MVNTFLIYSGTIDYSFSYTISTMKKICTSIIILISTNLIYAQTCELDNYEGPQFFDTYHEIWSQQNLWSIYNVHDPSVLKTEDGFVMYSTDVSMGGGTPVGLHKRTSTDLVNWTFEGTAFDGPPASAMEWMLQQNPDYKAESLWAPYISKVGDEYRLYYSLSVFGTTTSFMGLATSESATGPWTDRGKVLTTIATDNKNAIDPSVIIDRETGQHWMAYGSYWTGIYVVELEPETGLVKTPGDYGVNVARRGSSSIEGPEFAYRNGWYYLFVSYGWLEDSYNIRVGRSRTPEGPYHDFHGTPMVESTNNFPLIMRPYRFNHHEGWQGTGHCSVFQDGDKYFIAHQGRTSTAIYNMVLHLREIFWIEDWPVVSPQRFAGMPQCEIPRDSMVGKWEHMLLVTSGFHARPDIIELDEEGTINGIATNSWTLDHDTLTMSWNNGQYIDRLIVSWGWDWENRFVTLTYTGMNESSLNIWGKKINQEIINAYTIPENGSTYLIRNHHSNFLMESQSAELNANIRQRSDLRTDTQEWLLIADEEGYFQLSPVNSPGLVMEVANASAANGANIRLGENIQGEHQKWRFSYQDNGYFAILSKISNNARCAEVGSFAVFQGANIGQWEFLGGNNQLWRINRVQTGVDPGTVSTDMFANNDKIRVFPNPASGGIANIDLSGINYNGTVGLSLWNAAGAMVFQATVNPSSIYRLPYSLTPGMYIIRVHWDHYISSQRLVVY